MSQGSNIIKEETMNEIEELSMVKTLLIVSPYKLIDPPDSITPFNQNTLDFKENSMNSMVNPTSSKNNRIGRKKSWIKLFTSSDKLLSKNIKLIRATVTKGLTQLVIEKATTSASTSQTKALINTKRAAQHSEDDNEN